MHLILHSMMRRRVISPTDGRTRGETKDLNDRVVSRLGLWVPVRKLSLDSREEAKTLKYAMLLATMCLHNPYK
jgi:hypothetical protein